MSKIFCIMGKSGSGKDTIYKRILELPGLNLHKVVLFTTRPIRAGEVDGENYHFITEADLEGMRKKGMVVEERCYHTVHGDWYYATVQDGSICPDKKDYLLIGTPESYRGMKAYFGEAVMEPLYVEVEDGLRLARALERERSQTTPKYAEMCRRFLADAEDFSEENLKLAGIRRRFVNEDLDTCVQEIADCIQGNQSRCGPYMKKQNEIR